MYMGKIERDLTTDSAGPAVATTDAEGGILSGLALLAVALPYWTIRIFAGALWRDTRRIGRFIRLTATSYSEALRQR